MSRLSERFAASFPAEAPAWRTVGREAEHPVVTATGEAADVRPILAELADTGAYEVKRERDLVVQVDGPECSYALEVGYGTIEVIHGPHHDLHALREVHERAIGRVRPLIEARGHHLLGFGTQPATPPTRALMSPKERYGVLLDVIGDLWLWFTVTASDQVHVDIGRDEVVPVANLCNALAPVVVALFANSPIYGGQDQGVVSSREARMGEIGRDAGRHGMPLGPSRDVHDYVDRIAALPFLFRREGGKLVPEGRRFAEWVRGVPDDEAWDAFLLHDHYIWHSARPRSKQRTLELRSACQQPWDAHMTVAAFGLGLVTGWRDVAAVLDAALGADAWPVLRAWHHAVVRDGLAAAEPVPGLVRDVLDAVASGLSSRRLGEEVYLEPLYERVAQGRGPAHAARDAFAAGGVAGLVALTALR